MKKFNMSDISSKIKSSHEKFMSDRKAESFKIEADKGLNLTRVSARIRFVCEMFKGASVIDVFAEQNPSNVLGVDNSVVCFVLKKNGF